METTRPLLLGSAALFTVSCLFPIVASSIRWGILIPGLAWRGWVFTMVLPSFLSVWRGEQGSEASREWNPRT
jgi:hypothetical protein